MRKMKSKALFAASMLFLIPGLAFAGPKNSGNIKLEQPVEIGGTQLAPGQYMLTWEGSGPDATVSFTEGKKTIATAPAKLMNNPTRQEAIEMNTAAAGTPVLTAIDLKNLTLQFENAAPNAGN
jgi:hypothetical protein